jgi:hypothetical protein
MISAWVLSRHIESPSSSAIAKSSEDVVTSADTHRLDRFMVIRLSKYVFRGGHEGSAALAEYDKVRVWWGDAESAIFGEE